MNFKGLGKYHINLSANAIGVCFSTLLNLFFMRVLAYELGPESFALISIAMGMTVIINIVGSVISSTIGRFLIISSSINDIENANKIFNAGFFALSTVVVISIPSAFLGAWYSPNIMSISPDAYGARTVIFLILLANIFSSYISVFNISCLIVNRIDILAAISTSQILFRVLFTLLSIWLLPHNLLSIGMGYIVASILSVFISIIIFKKLTPKIFINIFYVEIKVLKQMIWMGTWIVVDLIGSLLLIPANTLILSRMKSIKEAGMIAIVMTLSGLLTLIGGIFNLPVQQEIYSSWAKNERKVYENAISSTLRISIGFMGFISVLFMLLHKQIIEIWLGSNYSILNEPLVLGVPIFCFSSSFGVYAILLNAQNRTHIISLSTGIAGICHILSCMIFAHFEILTLTSITILTGIWWVAKIGALVIFASNNKRQGVYDIIKYSSNYLSFVIIGMILINVLKSLIPTNTVVLVGIGLPIIFIMWLFGFLILLKPVDIKNLVGNKWGNSRIVHIHNKISYWKINIFSRRKQSNFTYFLRSPLQMETVLYKALPALNKISAENELSILITGCSNGAEAYTFSSEFTKVCERYKKIKITAFDISLDQIKIAEKGEYSRSQVENNPLITEEFTQRTFEKRYQDSYIVKNEYRRNITFLHANIFDNELVNKIGKWDIVAAQNYLIHMDSKDARHAFKNIIALMKSNAILVIDGIDLDLKINLTKEYSLHPIELNCKEIHDSIERRNSWLDSYVGLEPYDPNVDDAIRRYSTIFIKS